MKILIQPRIKISKVKILNKVVWFVRIKTIGDQILMKLMKLASEAKLVCRLE